MADTGSWQTPDNLFNVLDKGGEWYGMKFEGYHFDIDLAATVDNSKCDDYCDNYLKDEAFCISEKHNYNFKLACTDWLQTAWLNPPYSRGSMEKFIGKAWEDSRHCKIICLVKVDPSTKWWGIFWDYTEGITQISQAKLGCEVIFLPKRVKFDAPKGLDLSCKRCNGRGEFEGTSVFDRYLIPCAKCNSTGKRKISGPSFASALVVMDRRGL